jgi:predicted MFS family arabinose efflux permease
MLARTLSLYKNAYSGLTPSSWWLSAVMLVNRSGTMVLPFMTIYLLETGYSVGQAGLVMGVFGLGAVLGAYVGGKLTDRIGYYRVQLFTLIGGGILFMVLGQMKSYPLICIFSFILSFVNEAFRPANSTAIVAYSKPENRTRSYALNRLAVNLGWALGNALGGVLASINYELLFWVDGCTNIVAAIMLWFFLRPSQEKKPVTEKKDKPDPHHSPYRDKVFLWFAFLTMIFAASFFQFLGNTNAYYTIELHFSKPFIGLLGALNGILIAVVEMVLVLKLEGRRNNTYYIVRGVCLVGLAYFLFNLLDMNAAFAILVVTVLTIGEILALPFMNTFWIIRSADHNRGQYAGLYTIAWSIAQTTGPLVGSQIAERSGFEALWWTMGTVAFLTAIGYSILGKKINKPID